MTRILHILDHSLPLHSGYCFRTRAIMKAQIASGLTVAGVTGVRQNQHGYIAKEMLEEADGLPFFRTLAQVHGPSPVREWREVAALAERIDQVIRDWQPDILHAHSPALNGLAALRAAEKSGLPLVYEIRAFWEDAAVGNGTGKENSPRYWLTRQLENHVINGADAVAVICEGLRSDLMSRGVKSEKITISPNGVDLELFGAPPARDEEFLAELGLTGKPVLGFIGSFYDYEGLDDLIAAVPMLQRFHPDVHLLLVGGGPMEDALKAQVDQLGVGSAVTFTGRVPHAEVERFYGLMDIMVYPRKAMRLTDLVTPLKPLESMALGKLVLASNVGGHRELIRQGQNGYLFEANSSDALLQALCEAMASKNDWEAIAKCGRDYVETDRNWQNSVSRYQSVYTKLLP